MTFKTLHKDKKTNARGGVLKTKSGSIETPFFMPVSTKATPKYINSQKLNSLSNATISNAFILSLRPGNKFIKKIKGIKSFMNYKGINFTDSGGFQMYSKSFYIKSNEQHVIFKNPISGEKILMTPEKNMEIQLDIGSDVAMCLDRMPLYEDSKSSISESVKLTSLWAERCKKFHDKLQKNTPKNKKQLLFAITQGGIYKDLRKKSALHLSSIDFDGYAIGGFGMGETFKEEMKIVKQQKTILPENKPVYLMGIGNPKEILQAISYGVDIFDSKYPTEIARRGTILTSKGKLKILNSKYQTDKSPLDKNCGCFVCKNYTKAYVRFLLKESEPVGKELASYHNLYYLRQLIENAKKEIKKGTFQKFKNKIQKAYK